MANAAVLSAYSELTAFLPDLLQVQRLLQASLGSSPQHHMDKVLEQRLQRCNAAVALLQAPPACAAGREAEELQLLLGVKTFVGEVIASYRNHESLLELLTPPQQQQDQQLSVEPTEEAWRQLGVHLAPRPMQRSQQPAAARRQWQTGPPSEVRPQQAQQTRKPAPLGLALLMQQDAEQGAHAQQQQQQETAIGGAPSPLAGQQQQEQQQEGQLPQWQPGQVPLAVGASALGQDLPFGRSLEMLPLLPSMMEGSDLPTLSQLLEEPMMSLSIKDDTWAGMAAAVATATAAAADGGPGPGMLPQPAEAAAQQQQAQQQEQQFQMGPGLLSLQLIDGLLLPGPEPPLLQPAVPLHARDVAQAGPSIAGAVHFTGAAAAAQQQCTVQQQQWQPSQEGQAAAVAANPVGHPHLLQPAGDDQESWPAASVAAAAAAASATAGLAPGGTAVQRAGGSKQGPSADTGIRPSPFLMGRWGSAARAASAVPSHGAAAAAAGEGLAPASPSGSSGHQRKLSDGSQPQTQQPQQVSGGSAGNLSYRRVSFVPLQAQSAPSSIDDSKAPSDGQLSTSLLAFARPPPVLGGTACSSMAPPARAPASSLLARPPASLTAGAAAFPAGAPAAAAPTLSTLSVVQAGTAVRIAQSGAAASAVGAAAAVAPHATAGTAGGPVSYMSVVDAPSHNFSEGETSLSRLFYHVKQTGDLPPPTIPEGSEGEQDGDTVAGDTSTHQGSMQRGPQSCASGNSDDGSTQGSGDPLPGSRPAHAARLGSGQGQHAAGVLGAGAGGGEQLGSFKRRKSAAPTH